MGQTIFAVLKEELLFTLVVLLLIVTALQQGVVNQWVALKFNCYLVITLRGHDILYQRVIILVFHQLLGLSSA